MRSAAPVVFIALVVASQAEDTQYPTFRVHVQANAGNRPVFQMDKNNISLAFLASEVGRFTKASPTRK